MSLPNAYIVDILQVEWHVDKHSYKDFRLKYNTISRQFELQRHN